MQPRVTPTTASLGEWPAAKALMPLSLVEHIDLRHGHAGGDGHFLDDVEQLALVGIGGVRIDGPAAERFGHGAAAAGQLRRLRGAADDDDRQRAGGDAEEELSGPTGRTAGFRREIAMVPRLDAGEERGARRDRPSGRSTRRPPRSRTTSSFVLRRALS